MIDKREWQAASRDLSTERRRFLGDPPSTEELIAYTRGELPEEEEERIRELLVCYPDLARAIATPLLDEGEKPAAERRPWFWQFASGIAAAIAILLGATLWNARQELRSPRVATEEVLLLPGGARGGASGVVTLGGSEPVLLVLPLTQQHETFRVEIVEGDRVVWKSGAVRPRNDETLSIIVPRSFLHPGRYLVVLYDDQGTPLEAYPLRVEQAYL